MTLNEQNDVYFDGTSNDIHSTTLDEPLSGESDDKAVQST